MISPAQRRKVMTEGLEGVVAARTVLSDVDGAAGRLVIRGYAVEDLSGRVRFEEVAHLLFEGFFDALPDAGILAPRLGEARADVFNAARFDEDLASLTPIDA